MPILAYCIKIIMIIKDPDTRSNIISHLCNVCGKIPCLATECLRKLIISFVNENRLLKMKIMNLALFLLLRTTETTSCRSKLLLMIEHLMKLAKFDRDNTVRCHARFISHQLQHFFSEGKIDSEKFAERVECLIT